MGYNLTGTKPLMITEREVRLASVASGAYCRVRAMANVVSALTGGSIEEIQDWLMFHRIGIWPAGGEQLAGEWRRLLMNAAILDTEERAGRAAAADEAAWSRYGW